MMKKMWYFKCINCGKSLEKAPCKCGGILTPVYDLERAKEIVPSVLNRAEMGMGRFSPVLPVDPSSVSLGEGDTPLVKSIRLGDAIGLRNLYFKNETLNPTGSFKDRGIAVMVAEAKNLGYRSILLASTGNAGISASSYAARCSMRVYILIGEQTPEEKWRRLSDLNASIVRVRDLFEGSKEELLNLLEEVSTRTNSYNAFCWALANPISPEGAKIIAYEIAYQLGTPDFIVTPVGGGDNVFGLWKGFSELFEMGVVDGIPKLVGVQSENACPLVLSYSKGLDHVAPISNPSSIASGINVAFTGDHALLAIRRSGGIAKAVSDVDMLEGKRVLRKEGLIVETTSACVVPAVKALFDSGFIDSSDRVVCVLTGTGIKEFPESKAEPVTVEKDGIKISEILKG